MFVNCWKLALSPWTWSLNIWCSFTGNHHSNWLFNNLTHFLVIVVTESYRYCTLHCTGYMRSWPSSQLDSEGDTEKETSNLTCLVTVCRLLPHASHQPSKDVNVKPAEFVTRCAIDGKFTFVDQRWVLMTSARFTMCLPPRESWICSRHVVSAEKEMAEAVLTVRRSSTLQSCGSSPVSGDNPFSLLLFLRRSYATWWHHMKLSSHALGSKFIPQV